MIIIGTFEHSFELEQLLASIERSHIERKYIMVVPMDIDSANPFQFYSRKRELFYKGIEVGIACAAGSSVIGASIGFILTWGPIFWGLIAAAIGFFIGLGLYLFLKKYGDYKKFAPKQPEVTVIVQCKEEQSRLIIAEMWKYSAISVGKRG